MLDVHPPHEAVHTWKDFLIHVGTICVGLLIAVGLEQSVEAIHHHRQVAEVRASLRLEREQNRKNYASNVAMFRVAAAYLQNDLEVLSYLQQHPGTAEEKLPGVLMYFIGFEPMVDSEWKTAQQTGVTEHMPQSEVTGNDEVYALSALINSGAFEIFHSMNRANQYALPDPDLSHLTRPQIEEQIVRTRDCLTAVYQWGAYLGGLGSSYPDFAGGPTGEEIDALTAGIARSPQDRQRLLPARQQTMARVKPAETAARQAAEKK